ncbi:MAG: inositol monophosphatase family protein [Kiritimatiellae bacterium]|nr:inositol monophosphatase family protein [Kiritimatiellia bacterium]
MKNKSSSPALPSLDRLLSCAEAAARAGGAHALKHTHRRRIVAETFAHDVKLKLDRECQDVAERTIRKYFPRAVILGEETPMTPAKADMLWIIDPIDGTVNYFHGLPLWCCSVAVQVRGHTAAGAVYAPVLKECYTAHRERSSTCNGKPIAVAATRRLKDAVILTGLNKQNDLLNHSIALFKKLSRKSQKVRIMGSAALDICQVAAGRADAFYESGIYLWDAAAAALIVEQAGGRADIMATGPHYQLRIIASNGRLHSPLRRLIV